MKYLAGYTDPFISPVSGALATPSPLPNLLDGYIWIGDSNDEPIETFKLIDMNIDLKFLQRKFNALSSSTFILNEPASLLPNAQSLNALSDGLIKNIGGILETAIPDVDYLAGDLPDGEIFVGDSSNRASPQQTIGMNNLPDLTEGYIWVGDVTNRPIETAASPVINDATFIVQSPDDNLPNAQALDQLDNGLMKNVGGFIEIATEGSDYLSPYLPEGQVFVGNNQDIAIPSQIIALDNLPDLGVAEIAGIDLPAGKIWRGTESNRPIESDDLSEAEADILSINQKFASAKWVMNSGSPFSYGSAQFLDTLTPGALVRTDPGATGLLLSFVLPPGEIIIGGDAGPTAIATLPINNLTTLADGFFWKGDAANRPVPTQLTFAPNDASYILKQPNANLANAQAISTLPPSSLLQANPGADGSLIGFQVLDGQVLVGGVNGPQSSQLITLDNLPSLADGMVWEGNAAGRPIPVQLNFASRDSAYILTTPDVNLPNSQPLSGIGTGITKIAAGHFSIAVVGQDYPSVQSVTNAQQTADNARTSAQTANNTANAAQTTADAAQATAEGASTLALSINASLEPFAAPPEGPGGIGVAVTAAAAAIATISLSTIPDISSRINNLSLNTLPTAASGDVSVNNHKLINVSDPSSSQDAATKHYVDSQLPSNQSLVQIDAAHPSYVNSNYSVLLNTTDNTSDTLEWAAGTDSYNKVGFGYSANANRGYIWSYNNAIIEFGMGANARVVTIDSGGNMDMLSGGINMDASVGSGNINMNGNSVVGAGNLVTSVGGTLGQIGSTGGTAPILSLVPTGTASTYSYPSSLTTDSSGRVTSVSSGTSPATSITLSGDVTGSGSLSSSVPTTFAPNPVFTGTGSMTIPVGTTAQRPIVLHAGMIRLNAS